ncbi:histidine utilization repressor [Alteromonas sp. RKMC-009]|uniref:histidine utilization repressor n=1 Tax=Alteromonas sp. RKMC-009 TaxID=2267264 RepID=UPI000C3A4B46|nr:histidine utilization repressor [Alteromonas sp. RKMC-009]AYA65930.1 histidine utilization repressor [Alteromonas sp. RKMC-009]MBT81243.1 histidine utilization repressor [Alteromonadaceae bacterium]MEC7690229.1 histidine utilization repressor [Pseudomonadota bacterium]
MPPEPQEKGVKDTLHQTICNDIRQQILSGTWPPGYKIPFEHELVENYGCSRMTVNKAITSLVDEGLIHRRRRAGSFVARPKIQSVIVDIPDIQTEIANRGQPYGFSLLSRRKRTAQKRKTEELELGADNPLLELRCLHLASNRPFALEMRLINLNAVPEAEGITFEDVSPGHWLLEHVAWSKAQHRISAISANAEQAEALGIEEGTACLLLERQTWRGGEGITYVRQLFPGDAYNLLARFSPAFG